MFLLNQRVNSFNISTSINKIAIIILFRFSINLKNLNHFLKLINYLKSSIIKYTQRVNFLQKKKTTFIKQLFSFAKKLIRKRMIIKIQFYESIYNEIYIFKNL